MHCFPSHFKKKWEHKTFFESNRFFLINQKIFNFTFFIYSFFFLVIKMSSLTKNTCLMIGALLLVGLIIWYCMNKKETPKETYTAAGALDHLDSIDGNYELIESPDEAVPAEHFADLVDSGDQARLVKQPNSMGEELRPLDRFERLQNDAQIPLTAAHLPAFNVDVANPSAYAFAVQAPRVILKNRLAMQADPIRGDCPVKFHANIPMVAKSQYGRDSLRLDGTFSDQFRYLYNQLTGRQYKNMPIQVANQSTIGDYVPE